MSAADAPRRILVVEDEPDFAAFVVASLRSAGYEAETSTDLAGARNLLGRIDFDLVTLDLELAAERGSDLFFELRTSRRTSWVPIIIISGLPIDHPAIESLAATLLDQDTVPLPDAFLVKPVAPGELIASVEAAFRSRPRAVNAEETST